jgi:hypothetical protein
MSVSKHISAEERGGVLVLNQAYQPIKTTPLTRALLKLSLGKPVEPDGFIGDESPYTVEEWSRNEDGSIKMLHRPNGQAVPKPSVVRMKVWESKIPFRKNVNSRKGIYERDGYTCQYCAKKFKIDELTLDHIFPKSKGGDNDPTNLVTACKSCNGRKADRTPEEARMPLINPIVIYKVRGKTYHFCNYIENRPEWRPYLFLEDSLTGTDG